MPAAQPLLPVPPGIELPANLRLPLLSALGETTWHDAQIENSAWTAPKFTLQARDSSSDHPQLLVVLGRECNEECTDSMLQLDAMRAELQFQGKNVLLTYVSLGPLPPQWGERVLLSRDAANRSHSLQSRLFADADGILQERFAVLRTPASYLLDTHGLMLARAAGFPMIAEQKSLVIQSQEGVRGHEFTNSKIGSADFLTISLLAVTVGAFSVILWNIFRGFKMIK